MLDIVAVLMVEEIREDDAGRAEEHFIESSQTVHTRMMAQ